MHRIAFISDIHGNIDALDAVFQDIDSEGIDDIYCLGDIVGYGASPAECVEQVRARCTATVLGNHDDLTVKGVEDYVLSERVAAGIRYAQIELSVDQLKWLSELPLTILKPRFTMVHSSLYNPECFNYLSDHVDARLHLEKQLTSISFLGHTHVPAISVEKNKLISMNELTEQVSICTEMSRYAINVGSVGQPRDNDTRSAYAIFDPNADSVSIKRVNYDIRSAQKKIIDAGLPILNANRLEQGK
jgi:predicted phosphodiesterase